MSAAEPMFISSSSHPRLRLIKKLHQRKNREREGLVLLEGYRLVIDALEAGFRPEFVLLSEEASDGAEDVTRLQAALRGENFVRAPARLVAGLSDTLTPQGVLAVLEEPAFVLPSRPDFVLVCDNISDPGNLGTLLRSASGAGVSATLLLGGCDAWGLKALRAGMGAQLRVPTFRCASWDDISQTLGRWNLNVLGADAGGECDHFEVDWQRPSALVVGSEAHGLSSMVREDTQVSLCKIPLARSADGAVVESLNAAVAGSIILFEAQRQRVGQRVG